MPIRLLLVDDSAFIRYALIKHLEHDPDLTVVGQAVNGLEALEKVPQLEPDVIILDIEMPELDGLSALEQIMHQFPTPVIVLSSYTQAGNHNSVNALLKGAVDVVPKPSEKINIRQVVEQLIEKVKAAAGTLPTRMNPLPVVAAQQRRFIPVPHTSKAIVVMGASAGGPRALRYLLSMLPADFPAAIVIVQHIPAAFTASMAKRLDEICALPVREAVADEPPTTGTVLLAPGNFHLLFSPRNQVVLDTSPRIKGVRPAIDMTFAAAANAWHEHTIGVVLTGMGEDGTAGARQIKAAGGKVLAEHESTCLVYGMPQSVIKAGLADRVEPLPGIVRALLEWLS